MAEHDGIQLRHLLGEPVDDVFLRPQVRAGLGIAAEPGVRRDHDDVGPLVLPEFGNGAAHRVDGGHEAVGAQIFGPLPQGDDGGGDADHGDFHAAHGLDDVGRELAFGAARGERGVGGEPGELCVVAGLGEVGEAGVVFVVAHGHGVVAQQIHGAHHRIAGKWRGRFVTHRVGAAARNRLVDAFERRALYGVAAIDQQGVGVAGARLADQRGDFGEAARHGAAGDIVHRDQVAVQVCGGQQGDRDRLGGQQGGGAQKKRDQTAHWIGHSSIE